MKKKMAIVLCGILVVLMVVIVLVWKKNEDDDKNIGPGNRPNIKGKIVEVLEDNHILVEVTREGIGFKNGDKVLVKYNKLEKTSMSDLGESNIVEPALDAEVVLPYREKDIKNKDGYMYLEVEKIEMFE